MSSTTPFLGLTLYNSSTDQAVAFATFRAVWGGPATSSNFYKIDTGLFDLDARIDILESYRGAIPVPAVYISANYYEASGITPITAYTSGMAIVLSLDTTSNGTVTLNINALGTKSVMKIDSTGAAINLTGSDLVKNRRALFVYDGTRWLWVSANSADQIQIVGTAGNLIKIGSTNNLEDSSVSSSKVLSSIDMFTTTATGGGTTVLDVNSTRIQEFTGTTTQTVSMPVVATLTLGRTFTIINSSTGIVTVNSSGGNLIKALQPGTTLQLSCVLITGTTEASWKIVYGNGVPSIFTTAGDLVYGTGPGAAARLAAGTSHQSLRQNSALTAPEWGLGLGAIHAKALVHYTANPQQITATTYTDVTNATLNIVTTETCTIVMIGTGRMGADVPYSKTGLARPMIGGIAPADDNGSAQVATTGVGIFPFTVLFYRTGVAAGTITCKIQAKLNTSGGNLYMDAGTIMVFAIQE